MAELLRPTIYHAGLKGLQERTVAPVVKKLRPRFGVLTHGRVDKLPGHDQKVVEGYAEGKHLVYVWEHGSHVAVAYAKEAAQDSKRTINKEPQIKTKIEGYVVTAARSMITGQQGPVIQDLAKIFQEYVETSGGDLLLIDRPGENSNSKKDDGALAKIRHKSIIKQFFVEGRVQPGRRIIEKIKDEKGNWRERKTKYRNGLGEIGEENKVDPNALADTLGILKNFIVIPAVAVNDYKVFDPDKRLPGLRAILTVLGLWSNKFVQIKLNMPITNERMEEDLGKIPSRKKDPEGYAIYVKKLNHYIQNEIAEVSPYEMQGKYQNPIVS